MAEEGWEPDIPEPGEDPARVKRRDRILELIVVAILSVTSLLTAVASFEATRWAGEQSDHQNEAARLRLDASRAETDASASVTIDMLAFSSFLDAYGSGNTELADFYRQRFRDELLPAFNAWIATDPRNNPDAPNSPFEMPEYQLASRANAEAFDQQAEQEAELAIKAATASEQYVQTVVLFAMILFLGGMSSRIALDEARLGMVCLALLLLVASTVRLATLPFA